MLSEVVPTIPEATTLWAQRHIAFVVVMCTETSFNTMTPPCMPLEIILCREGWLTRASGNRTGIWSSMGKAVLSAVGQLTHNMLGVKRAYF